MVLLAALVAARNLDFVVIDTFCAASRSISLDAIGNGFSDSIILSINALKQGEPLLMSKSLVEGTSNSWKTKNVTRTLPV